MNAYSIGRHPIWLSILLILAWLATACAASDAAGIAAPLEDVDTVSLTVYRDPT